MSDPADAFRSADGGLRERARLVHARRRSLRVTGLTAVTLAGASSMATLLGARSAPSGAFVAQCFTLGVLALVTPALARLRHLVAVLSLIASAVLLLFVVLEVLRSGAVVPIEVAACAVLLPPLAVQLRGRWRRAAAIGGAALVVFLAALLAGGEYASLVQLGVALSFIALVALLAADVLAAARARYERRFDELRNSIRRERARTQVREEMIANLSHDLRNPLAIAVGFAEMAEDEDLSTEDRAHALSGVRRSLWEMSQLVENVLDRSADRAGALVSSPEPLDLELLCREALAATRILLRRRPITLSGTIEPGLVVYADRHRLARVIGNLLSNACKYTTTGEIRLQATSSARSAVIRIRDTGSGIAPEAMPHLFDRFRRAHEGGPAGVGLGLAIAHRLTERMGGTLEVASELGVGSTFTITLPLCAAPRSESVAA